MIKMNRLFFMALALSFTVSSCFFDDDGPFGCINGEGPMVTEELNLADFSGIELDISADVVVKQGPEQEVIVEGKQNIIDELERDVKNGIWEIDVDGCVTDMGNMRIFVTLPDITSLKISGSGKIESENVLLVNDINLRISGSGDMDLDLEADDIDAKISGSGEMILDGLAKDLNFKISGSGDLHAFGLETQFADIDISGSGDAEVFVVQELDVKISGSGDVTYLGNPLLDVSISGSGKVKDGN